MRAKLVDGALEPSAEWLAWCRRWRELSPLSPSTRSGRFSEVLRAGRWLAVHQPSITSPADWTAETALTYARYVEGARIGDFSISEQVRSRVGEPLSTQTRGAALVAVRSLFLDLQGWGLIEPRFNPLRALATPRSVRRGCCVNPRPIDDGHWLKLRTAALSIGREDLPRNPSGGGPHEYYPIEMVRAVAAALMFSGCRADEITRFEVGCVRVERVSEHVDPRTGETVLGGPPKQPLG